MMNVRVFFASLVALQLVFFSCQPLEPTDRVLLVNIRGASYTMLQKYLETTDQRGYLHDMFTRNKIWPLQPVTNAVTATNLASFETGVFPGKHGIIGHTFGSAKNRYAEPVSGFSRLFETETIWETASANGLQVLNIGSLLLHSSKEESQNVHTIAQGQALDNARLIRLTPASARSTSSEAEFVQLLANRDQEGRGHYTSLHGDFRLYFHQVGTLEDGKEAYQALLLDNDHNLSNGYLARLAEGEWGEIIIGELNELDVSVRLKLMRWDREKQEVEVFIRSPFVNRGRPLDFLKAVESGIGACKGWLSIPNYFSGEVNEETIREEIDAEVNYVMDILRLGYRHGRYNLILLDYPLLDRYGHLFSMTDPRQPGHSEETAKRYERYVLEAYNRLDNDLAEIGQLAKDGNYDLIVASGHGFSAIHSSLNVNRWLRESGFAGGSNDEWQVRAFPGKVSAHIYLNKETVMPERQAALLQKLREEFEGLSDPVTGQVVVDESYTNEELKSIDLHHVNSGDLWVLLKPGYVFQPEQFSERPTFGAPTFRGDHGYSAQYAENMGLIISQNLPANPPVNPASVVDVAPSVAHLLNIALSDRIDGHSLFLDRN
jgi:predicted AlkP superfamily phosphohydrolase/phosphomutase